MGEFDGFDTSGAPASPFHAPPPDVAPRPRLMRRRVVTVAVGLGAAAGVAIGATVAASAATTPSTSAPGGSSTTTTPGTFPPRPGLGGRFHAGLVGPGGGGWIGFGPGGGGVVHGQYTVKGPNGYETLDVRSGTVSDITNTSGSTWSLTVKSADGTSGTFTVNSSTSVNGGESGIASVKSGDTVNVTGTVSGATTTATDVVDQTTLQANGKGWLPMRPMMPPGAPTPNAGSGSSSGSSTT